VPYSPGYAPHDREQHVKKLESAIAAGNLPLSMDLLQRLRELVPGAYQDGRINWETLRAAAGETPDIADRYDFTWVGNKTAMHLRRVRRSGIGPCSRRSRVLSMTASKGEMLVEIASVRGPEMIWLPNESSALATTRPFATRTLTGWMSIASNA
jgi:hypothetical protein